MEHLRYRSLYVAEARRAVAEAAGALGRTPPELRATLRAFHTLEGMSATMGLGPVATLARALEDVCESVLSGATALEGARPLVEASLGRLEEQIAEVEAGLLPPYEEPLAAALRRYLVSAAQTGFRLLPPAEPHAERDPAGSPPRVPTDRRASLLLACARLRARVQGDATAEADVDLLTAGVRAAHDELEAAQGVPFGALAAPLRRRLREVCGHTGRVARLQIRGGAVRLDPAVLAPLQAALVHLLDNAVAHGIEAADERGSKGPVGSVRLHVAQRGGSLVIALRDDGRGLDAARLREAARDPRGDPVALALTPGLSTCVLGPVSGRGEGLPAAAALVRRLGGQLAVHSSPGHGTRVEISLPVGAAAPHPSLPPQRAPS